jgi:hypothetical protein
MIDNITPNDTAVAATENTAVLGLDQIAAKMDAMKAMTQRNQIRATDQPVTGETAEANAESPVAPDGSDAQPEVAELDSDDLDSIVEPEVPEGQEPEVNSADTNSSQDELIDFIEFAETNPNAKFKFMRNGKEVVIDAKKAASILGQGGAIHEEARQLKIEKSEFEEYSKGTRERQEGLLLAMEFTVQPRLQTAYDEIVKTQNYQNTFQQQLAQTQDPGQQARIQASMAQNERYIQQQSQIIQQIKPAVEQFKDIRRQQVAEVLDRNRKAFTDRELKNEYVYNELRDKITKIWPEAQGEIMPGIKNLDLISSDEKLLALVRDGLKFRDRSTTKQAGTSVAALTGRKTSTPNTRSQEDNINNLREKAKGGDKKAADNLLMQQLSKLRAARTGR